MSPYGRYKGTWDNLMLRKRHPRWRMLTVKFSFFGGWFWAILSCACSDKLPHILSMFWLTVTIWFVKLKCLVEFSVSKISYQIIALTSMWHFFLPRGVSIFNRRWLTLLFRVFNTPWTGRQLSLIVIHD